MSRSITRSSISILFLSLSFLLVVVNPAVATNFDYETAKADPNDLTFYQPPMTTEPYPLTSAKKVKNVILCIGDGMGINTVTLASTMVGGPGGKLNIERLPVSGLARTYSADSFVADSAAGGTALATGIKTKNGMVGMNPDEKGYCSILEAAQDKGMATGLVVTCTMSHATPASFGSHVKSRKLEPAIAEQLLANRINVLFGGGRKYFLPQSVPGSGRKDDLDLIAQAKEAGYTYVETLSEFRSAHDSHVLGLFQLDALKTAGPEPTLAQMTNKAIRLLNRTSRRSTLGARGFFLMVEGSQIDWECHANKANAAVRQMLLFDQAVETAVDFALRDGHTLVIVTTDHETGGVTLVGAGSEDEADASLGVKWSTKGHSGGPVGVWALGPGATRFTGVQEITDIPRKIAQLLGIRPFPRPVK